MIIKNISWDEILEIWERYLWPDRKSKIKPAVGMKFNGTWERYVGENDPTFFGAYENGILVGVNSGHKAERVGNKQYYRSRGLYVFPKYRGKGIAQALLQKTIEQAEFENCDLIWSIPRVKALPTYLKVGFKIDRPAQDLEYGPNVYAYKELK